jgi:hypothetical protein
MSEEKKEGKDVNVYIQSIAKTRLFVKENLWNFAS